MKNGEKFALLEEGRLSSYEQLNVMGGGTLVCKSDGIKTPEFKQTMQQC